MDIVHSGLKPDRSDTRHAQYLAGLFVSNISSVHEASVGLLNPVAIDGIIEKECEVREEIQPIILPIRVGKELTARCRIVVIIQPCGAANRITSLRRIDGAEPIERAIIDGAKRNLT